MLQVYVDALVYFYMCTIIGKENASSVRRCFSILLHVHHQSHVGYPIDIQFLAMFLLTYPQ